MPNYKDRARQRGKERQEKTSWTASVGPNTVRIAPTPGSKTTPDVWMEYQVHENVGPNKAYVRCGHDPGDEKNGSCYIDDVVIPKLQKKGKEERAAALAPKNRLAVQIFPVDEDGNFGKPKLWHPSSKLSNSLLTSILGSKKRNYEDPKKGYNITFERTGTKFKDTRYGPIEPDDEPTKVPSSLVSMLKPFSEVRGIPKYNEELQKAALAGEDLSEFYEKEKKKKAKKGSDSESGSESAESEDVDDIIDSDSGSGSESSSNSESESSEEASGSGSESESGSASESESGEDSGSESSSNSESESESKEEKRSKKKKK